MDNLALITDSKTLNFQIWLILIKMKLYEKLGSVTQKKKYITTFVSSTVHSGTLIDGVMLGAHFIFVLSMRRYQNASAFIKY